MIAYCWASGLIEFGCTVPSGAIVIATGATAPLHKLIEPTSRLAYDGALLVPGVPEAADQQAAGDALAKHLHWLGQHAPPGITVAGARP